jgi:hypothetical protein
LAKAKALCDAGAGPQEIKDEIDYTCQVLGEDLRGALGLYEWNDGTPGGPGYPP